MFRDEDHSQELLLRSSSLRFLKALYNDIERCLVEYPNAIASTQFEESIARSPSPARPSSSAPISPSVSPLHYLVYVGGAREQFQARAVGFKVALHLLRVLVLVLRTNVAEMRSNLASLMGSALHNNLLAKEAEGGKVISKIQ